MEVYVSDKKIILPNKEFSHGSEGKVYLYNNKIYKIYYPETINEGFGDKIHYHKYLMSFDIEQLFLPTDIIYNKDGNYLGYVTEFALGNQKDKTGITMLNKEVLIHNLEVLENSFDILSENYILAEDVTPLNCLIDLENDKINIIDPGRYRDHCLSCNIISEYKKANNLRLEHLISLLLYLDFIKYKPVGSKRKEQLLNEYIIQSKRNLNIEKFSEFFEYRLYNYENIDEYAKSLKKYIK